MLATYQDGLFPGQNPFSSLVLIIFHLSLGQILERRVISTSHSWLTGSYKNKTFLKVASMMATCWIESVLTSVCEQCVHFLATLFDIDRLHHPYVNSYKNRIKHATTQSFLHL